MNAADILMTPDTGVDAVYGGAMPFCFSSCFTISAQLFERGLELPNSNVLKSNERTASVSVTDPMISYNVLLTLRGKRT